MTALLLEENGRDYIQQHHWETLWRKGAGVMPDLSSLVGSQWYFAALWTVAGFTGGVWLGSVLKPQVTFDVILSPKHGIVDAIASDQPDTLKTLSPNQKYVRFTVVNRGRKTLEHCIAHIRSISRRLLEEGTSMEIPLPQPLSVNANPFKVYHGIDRPVDFLITTSSSNRMGQQFFLPNTLRDIFIEPAIYRFDILVNGDGAPKSIIIDVNWTGIWDQITARRVA
jgi:hypothetical protein